MLPTTERVTPDFLLCAGLLSASTLHALRSLLKAEAHWRRYEELNAEWTVHTFARKEVRRCDPALDELRAAGAALIERECAAVVGNHFAIVAHRMGPGEAVAPHNDSPHCSPTAAQYRLIVFADEPGGEGGDFVIHGPDGTERRIPPASEAAVLMRLSDNSFHSVDTVRAGQRYSIVVSYWAYPLLHACPREALLVEHCMRSVIAAGLEELEERKTSAARRSYDAYAWLANRGAPLHVCISALLHLYPYSRKLDSEVRAPEIAEVEHLLAMLRAPQSVPTPSLRDDLELLQRALHDAEGAP